jgi:coenzyme F420-reducing hydrogenase delta subunit
VSIVFVAGLVVTSCNSPAKKAEKAKENVEEARHELNEAKVDAELQQQKAATAEEWNEFKSDSEEQRSMIM